MTEALADRRDLRAQFRFRESHYLLSVVKRLSLHHGKNDIAAPSRMKKRSSYVRRWHDVRTVHTDGTEIGVLARLDRANLMLDPERAGAIDGHHAEQIFAVKGTARLQPCTLHDLRDARFLEQIDSIVAGNRIGADANRDACRAGFDHWRNAMPQARVGDRAMGDCCAPVGDPANVVIVHAHTMNQQ